MPTSRLVEELLASPALRRALGAALAGRGPLRRDHRLRDQHAPPQCLALPRLRHPRLQRGQALRPLRPRADSPAMSLGADAATGFLVAGPDDKVKSPDPVLTANQRADELHDMVSTTGSAFLGLTVGCARCHNHKFDPDPADRLLRAQGGLRGRAARRAQDEDCPRPRPTRRNWPSDARGWP